MAAAGVRGMRRLRVINGATMDFTDSSRERRLLNSFLTFQLGSSAMKRTKYLQRTEAQDRMRMVRCPRPDRDRDMKERSFNASFIISFSIGYTHHPLGKERR